VLTVSLISTSLAEVTKTDGAFNIWHGNGKLNIQTLGDSWDGSKGDIRILNLSGKLIQLEKDKYFNKGSNNEISISLQNGVYFVEIRSGVQRFVGKVVIK
jgi:hypothetical protein